MPRKKRELLDKMRLVQDVNLRRRSTTDAMYNGCCMAIAATARALLEDAAYSDLLDGIIEMQSNAIQDNARGGDSAVFEYGVICGLRKVRSTLEDFILKADQLKELRKSAKETKQYESEVKP
ncbi:MAG: hypothetical protein ABIJ86_17255 [Spirochaetota bacterium]